MKLLQILLFFTGIFLCIPNSIQAQSKQGKKKRIAVFLFDDKTDNGRSWWGQRTVGEGISDMLTTELVKTEEFTVIERSQIDAILKEQDFGASGAVTPESAAKIGQILGVELAVMGAVTEFGYDKRRSNVSVSGVRVGVGKEQANVAIDLRLVNTSTAEILSAENIRRDKNAPSISASTRKISFGSENEFNQSIVGKAAREAVEDIVSLITKNAENIPWSAKIVTAQDGQVFINSGNNDGVKVGDTFVVYRKGQELIDPDTGLSLGSVDKKVGIIKVTDNSIGEGKASSCTIIEKIADEFKRGDLVKEN